MTVTFATKCWGGDYYKFLLGAYERKLEALEYIFDEDYLVVNNGVPEDTSFQFDTVMVGKSLYNHYASGEIKALQAASTDYLCFVQGDCLTSGGNWIDTGIEVLQSEPEVLIVSPASEVNTWHDHNGYDHYCSDQAFVVRVADFMNPEVYQVPGVDPDYPDYGGNSFEAMVGRYLKYTGKKRKILTDFYVHHPAY